jgi:hypothetical protein
MQLFCQRFDKRFWLTVSCRCTVASDRPALVYAESRSRAAALFGPITSKSPVFFDPVFMLPGLGVFGKQRPPKNLFEDPVGNVLDQDMQNCKGLAGRSSTALRLVINVRVCEQRGRRAHALRQPAGGVRCRARFRRGRNQSCPQPLLRRCARTC